MRQLEQLFFRRPRILNLLHACRLIRPTSQTTQEERNALARYAKGCDVAVEIGTYQGASSVYIVGAMSPSGRLWCVDPWPIEKGGSNPCWTICERHFRRSGFQSRIEIIREFSKNADSRLPALIDFVFIDGDHSWSGIDEDWNLMAHRIRPGGCMCLHDSVVPPDEPWRASLDSNRFFEEVVQMDPRYELVECVHSMVIIRRL